MNLNPKSIIQNPKSRSLNTLFRSKTGRPLPAITIAFGLGILAAAVGKPVVLCILAALLFMVVLAAFTRRILWLSTAVLILLALLGSCRYFAAVTPVPNDIARIAPAIVTLTGVVQSDIDVASTNSSSLPPMARCLLVVRRLDFPASTPEQAAFTGNVTLRLPLGETGQAALSAPTPVLRELPHYGDELVVSGRLQKPAGLRNPGGIDAETVLARKEVSCTLTARHPQDWRIVRPRANGSLWTRLAFMLRQDVIRHARVTFSPERAGVLEGLLLGARGDLQGSLNADFARTGTSHLLATAGLHVGLIVTMLLMTLRFIGMPRRPALLAALLALALYAIMTGGHPSAVRAVIVATIFLFGILLEREPDLANALSLAALTLMLLDPLSLFDAGFQLTFATVITIALLMPLAEGTIRRAGERISADWPGSHRLRRCLQLPVGCFFLSVTAQIGAAPLIACHFNELSWIAPVANTLLAPLAGMLLACGFTAVVLSKLYLPFAWPFDRLLDHLLGMVIALVRACAAPSWASVSVLSPPSWFLVLYYAIVWSLAWNWQKELRKKESQQPNRINSRTIIAERELVNSGQ